MKSKMLSTGGFLFLVVFAALLSACGTEDFTPGLSGSGHRVQSADYARGTHGGRLLTSGDFTLELAIFETGVPPEFRAWATLAGQPVEPGDVNLEVRLTRLGERIDRIRFQPQDDFLRGDQVVYEPHSFVVSIDAQAGGTTHHWEYENFEGRTRIGEAVAAAFELETEIAGPARMREMIEVFGHVEPNAERISIVSARFDGLIQAIHASQGDTVQAGEPLLTIESDQSLKSYVIRAPISGTVTERSANVGEPTAGRPLLTIIDASSVWVNLAIFPADLRRVRVGAPVTVITEGGGDPVTGAIGRMNIVADSNQAVMARVVLDNTGGRFSPGSFVRAQVQIAEYAVPLAVKRDGLQAFRDFTVVFAQFGDVYEVRMLELGRQDAEWAEVLGGLDPGTRYVTTNSYLVKADIEKAGASHDH